MSEKEKIRAGLPSRRKFIRNLGTGALATAAAGLAGQEAGAAPASASEWTETYDWVCVGSGFGGCASALAAHDLGMKAIVIEKYELIGGVTSQSGGDIWVPLNALEKAAGISDSREEALEYLIYIGSGYSRPEYREILVDNALRVSEYLEQKADFHFHLGGNEFFAAKKRGRLLTPDPFPAETLGPLRKKVLNSVFVRGLDEALQGMGTIQNAEHYGPYRTSAAGLELWKKKLGPEKFEAVIKKDDSDRVGGAALIGYAVRALQKRGVEIRTGTAAVKLVKDGETVTGVVVERNGKQERLRARKGVVLATGGDLNGRGSYGDTWSIAAEVGGALSSTSTISSMASLPAPGEVFPGSGKPFGRSNAETGMSHGLIVNRFGERFGNEAFFQDFGGRMKEFDNTGEHRFRNFPCFLIFDSNLLEKHTFVGLPPGNTELLEWLNRGDTVTEVAAKMKLPADKLQATVARFNDFVQKGKDTDFNRDPATMGALERAPFYGAKLDFPDPFFAESKLVINPLGQVVRTGDEKPIAGLYACGALVAFSRIWGVGYQMGHSLMSAAVFGFLAAEHATQRRV